MGTLVRQVGFKWSSQPTVTGPTTPGPRFSCPGGAAMPMVAGRFRGAHIFEST